MFWLRNKADETPPRILFLDDDPERARAFREVCPEAAWVETVEACLEKLAEPWDEVHLDHDLGGEVFVDRGRPDCGMEVVRWLVAEARPHLRSCRFVVHSHNPEAACIMAWTLRMQGYRVEERPFGTTTGAVESEEPKPRWLDAIRRRFRGRP
ncbi:MAG: cyclic-phosphate processing receiver domain-containing protein [Isosphaeraceae bacterium]